LVLDYLKENISASYVYILDFYMPFLLFSVRSFPSPPLELSSKEQIIHYSTKSKKTWLTWGLNLKAG